MASNLKIPGTRPLKSFHLMVSSGCYMLDDLIGGGIPVGGVMLLEEDSQQYYNKAFLRYYLAEGALNHHHLYVASLDVNPEKELISQLPTNIEEETVEETKFKDEEMKIAFRYQSLPTQQPTTKRNTFAHHYDISKYMDENAIKRLNIDYYKSDEDVESTTKLLKNPTLNNVLQDIINLLKRDCFKIDHGPNKNVLRIALHGFGSPMWTARENTSDLRQFIFYLKCLLRKFAAVCFITLPTYLSDDLKECFEVELIHLSDISVSIKSFAGTKLVKNKALQDYHGYFLILKVAAVGRFQNEADKKLDYAFKHRRKTISIDVLHLPPDDFDDDADEDNKRSIKASMSCSSNRKSLLDF